MASPSSQVPLLARQRDADDGVYHEERSISRDTPIEQSGQFHYSHRSPWLRAAILGANDGLVSTSSLMMGVSAVNSSRATMLLSGLSGLVAGACSMAIGEYVSVHGQRDTEEADLHAERVEHASGKEAEERELEELARIYQGRGLTRDLAVQVATQLSRKDAFRAHARDELGIDLDSMSSPWQAAATSASAFVLGGLLPLISGTAFENLALRIFAVIIAATFGFIMFGAVGAWLGGAQKTRAAARCTAGGWLAMIITYVVLWIFGSSSL